MATQPNQRNKELAAIHAAKRELQMDDESYRAMLWSVARVHSAADLDAGGRQRVLDHLKAVGWAPHRRGRSRPAANKADLVAKVRAQLAAADRPDRYADGMARKMFGVERFEWCTADQLHRIVAALNYNAKRHGRGKR